MSTDIAPGSVVITPIKIHSLDEFTEKVLKKIIELEQKIDVLIELTHSFDLTNCGDELCYICGNYIDEDYEKQDAEALNELKETE